MAQNEVSMQAKLLAVFTAGLTCVNVSAVCRDLQISRQTFYKYRARFQALGPAGLVESSRAPRSNAHAISAALEDEIVRLRKTMAVDNGAQMIRYHLQRDGWERVPAVSTIHRVLVARGLVTPQPHKRPKSAAWKRFVWPQPNDAWQIDATRWALADGRDIWIMDVLDDHSRVLVAARVCSGPTGQAAWDALSCGVAEWGLPARVMSDNGTCFTTRLNPRSQHEAAFDRSLAAMGVRHICSTPGHPQTCGKLERSHQTTKRWLRSQPPAETPQQLQDLLDTWREHYNVHRPHRALHGSAPAQAWRATERATPGDPIVEPTVATRRMVQGGRANYRQCVISVGVEFDGSQVLIIDDNDDLTIYGPGGLLRRLTITADQRSYPRGAKPGGPRRNRLIGTCS